MSTKTEFRDTIELALEKHADTQLNIASPIARELVAEEIAKNIKSKFHVFRINRLYTDES